MEEFHDTCISRLHEMLKEFPVKGTVFFEKIKGKHEDYFMASVTVTGHVIVVYLYPDDKEAGFEVDGRDWIMLEKYDYDSPDKLISALVAKLRKVLQDFTGEQNKGI